MRANDYLIGGIQQLGVGIDCLSAGISWYAEAFGLDVMVFQERAPASFMTAYTGGEVHLRHAALLLNLAGGAGVEAWQYLSRKPRHPLQSIIMGDWGICAARIKTPTLLATFDTFYAAGYMIYDEPVADPAGQEHFFMADQWGNLFSVYEDKDFFTRPMTKTAGIGGAIIGVRDMATALRLYKDVLGYTEVVYDHTDVFADWAAIPGGYEKYRRLLLRKPGSGPFGKLFGTSTLELVQALDRRARHIFQGRLWGDFGFIHVCFDVVGMDALGRICAEAGFPFTIDSGNDFFMEKAAGRFAYIEGPDHTLIEFVETLRLPVTKSWALSVREHWKQRHIPSLLLRMMSTKRLKKKRGQILLPQELSSP